MSSTNFSDAQLWKSAVYASHHSDLQTTIKGKGSVATSPAGNAKHAILEPSGTSIVLMVEGTISRPQAAFSLMQCSIDAFSEHFLPDITWTLDGSYICALTTHGQLFVLSASGDIQQHWPGPLNGQEHYGGSFPVSITPLPDSKLCVLCADASVHLLDIASSTCKPFSRIRRSFKVGRTATYCQKTAVLLLVGDGSASAAASRSKDGQEDGAGAPPQQAAQPLSKSAPVIVSWSLRNLNRPKRLLISKPGSKQPPTEVPVPLVAGTAWRSCISTDGRFSAVLDPVSGWHILSMSETNQLREIQLLTPPVTGNISEGGAHAPVVTSFAWDDVDSALIVCSDDKVYRVTFKDGPEGTAEVAATGVSVASGAVVVKFAARQETEESSVEPSEDVAPLAVMEPEWEDGAATEQGKNYSGSESEMADRKGNAIPCKFGVTKRIIGWRVSSLLSSPPGDAIANLFSVGSPPTSEKVTRALEIAHASGVSPASVWQQIWESSNKQEADVARLVESTSGHPEAADFLWQEAFALTASSTVAVRALLAAALVAQGETEMHAVYECIQSGADASTLDENTLAACESRMALLQKLDSVATYCVIHGANAEVAGLRDMLGTGIPNAAASLAASAHISSLSTVLARHACSIGASQLDVLHYLPEAMDVRVYLPLLQQVAWWDGTVPRERELDFLEGEAAVQLLAEHLMARVEVTDPFLATLAASRDPSVRSDGVTIEAVDEWVVERALLIDDATGLLPLATNLLKGWLRLGRESVSTVLTGLHMVQTLLKHSDLLDEGIIGDVAELSGRSFVEQTVPGQVQYVLRAVFPHETIEDAHQGATIITEVVAPALSVVPAREQVLESVLQLDFPERAEWVVSLVKADLQAGCVLFGNLSCLSAAVLRLVNNYIPEKASQSTPHWASLLHALEAVKAAARNPGMLPDAQRDRWVEKFEQAAGRVCGARILSKHGMHLPACALAAADRRGACGLLRSMLTTAAAAAASSNDPSAAFGRIWNDCRDIHSFVFEGKGLSLAYLLREFLRATLLAQQWDVADRYMKGTTHVKLSKSGVTRTLGGAARDMFAAAKVISASDPALAACMRTLSLRAASSPELQTSLNLVNAVRIAAAEIGAKVDKRVWESLAFAGIFTTPTANSSCASLASPMHSEAALVEPMDISRLPEFKRHLLDSALAAASVAPASHFELLCELVSLLYGTEEASLGVASSARSAALLTVAETFAQTLGGEQLARTLAVQLCNDGHQPAWRLASQLGCSQAMAVGVPNVAVASLSPPGAVAESVGPWDDTSQQLTAFALASCDEAALPQMLAAAEGQALQHSSARHGDAPEQTDGGSKLGGAQVLGLASGCAAADGVLAEVSQLLQGCSRQGHAPEVEQALGDAALRCVGLAEAAAGDSSAHTCGLSTAATTCLFEMAHISGAGSLVTFTDKHVLPQQPKQRSQLLQCAVRAAALQVMHACNVDVTRELLHQSLDAQVATACNTERSMGSTASADAAATLETLQERLDSHLRDQELRVALGADSAGHMPTTTARGGFAAAAVRQAEPPVDGAAVADGGAAAAEAGTVRPATSGAMQLDALLELAGRCGASLASGTDASQDIQKSLKLAAGYNADAWWVHWGIVRSAVASCHPPDPSDTSLLTTLAPHTQQLQAHADAALWLLFVWLLPDLDRSLTVPAQWLCFVSVATECAQAVPTAPLQQQQLQSLAYCCVAAAEIECMQAALPQIVLEAATSIMQAFWQTHPVPQLLHASVPGPEALPVPPQCSALQAVNVHAEVQHTALLRQALYYWPLLQPSSSGDSAADADHLQGVCGINYESADMVTLVKLLSGAAGHDLDAAALTALACECLSALSGPSAVDVAAFCAGFDGAGTCLLPEVVTGGSITALALHPAASHALLHCHPALSHPHRDELPAQVGELRALVDTWAATSAVLAPVQGSGSVNGTDASASTAWLLDDLDAVGAHTLSLAEAALQAQGGGAAASAAVIAGHAVSQGVQVTWLSESLPSLLAAVSGAGAAVDESTLAAEVHNVVVTACAQQADEAVAAVAGEAEAGVDCVSAEGYETEGITMMRYLVWVLDGAEASQLGSARQARGDLLRKLADMESQLGGAAMASSVMHCAVSLHAELAAPERWGEVCSAAHGGQHSVLHATARATLGPLWGSEEPLRVEDLASMHAVDARIVDLVQSGASLEQLQALFVLLKDVLDFGGALGDSRGMFAAAGAVAAGLAQQPGAFPDALRVLLCCPPGDSEELAQQVQAVSGQLQAAGRPWAACAVCMVAGSDSQHYGAVARLMHGDQGATDGNSVLLENAAELADASVLGAVLWGLSRGGGETARGVMVAPVSMHALRPALNGLPAIGVTEAVYECALPRVAARMCMEGGTAGVLVAADVVAEYTNFHSQLHGTEALCSNLAQYLCASANLAEAELQRRGGEEGASEQWQYGVNAELVAMLRAGHREVQAQLDKSF